jgi:hypothetical protein
MAGIGNYSVFLLGKDHFDEIDIPEWTQEGDPDKAKRHRNGFDDQATSVCAAKGSRLRRRGSRRRGGHDFLPCFSAFILGRLLRRMAARGVGGFDRRRGVIGSGRISRTRGRREEEVG